MNCKPNRPAALLTAADVATQLSLSDRTIRRLIESGELHVHYFGRAVRIAQDDLDSFIAKSRK